MSSLDNDHNFEEAIIEQKSIDYIELLNEMNIPQNCPGCFNTNWDVELLPNRVSAKIKCEVCGKRFLVRKGCEPKALATQRQAIPKDVQREVWRRDEGKCVECGSNENLEFDHIIPIALGGGNTARNIQLLCEQCNRKKSAKEPGA